MEGSSPSVEELLDAFVGRLLTDPDERLWRFHAILGTIMLQPIGAPGVDLAAESLPFGTRVGDA